jgi:telomere length regulation protein
LPGPSRLLATRLFIGLERGKVSYRAEELSWQCRSDLDYVHDSMDDFLTPVSTSKVKQSQETSKPHVQETQASPKKSALTIDSPNVALGTLKQEPDFETVTGILKYLSSEAGKDTGFNLITPDPIAANIAFQLTNNIIPNYWGTLKERGTQSKQLATCLRNPCGIGAILNRLRPLIADCRQKKSVDSTRDASSYIEDLLDVLERVLRDDQCSINVWNDVQKHAKNTVQGNMMWKEYVAQVASGRVLSLIAEAEDVLKEKGTSRSATWLANGNEYAAWLGRNIAALMKEAGKSEEAASAVMAMCGKVLTLGYTGRSSKSSLVWTCVYLYRSHCRRFDVSRCRLRFERTFCDFPL